MTGSSTWYNRDTCPLSMLTYRSFVFDTSIIPSPELRVATYHLQQLNAYFSFPPPIDSFFLILPVGMNVLIFRQMAVKSYHDLGL